MPTMTQIEASILSRLVEPETPSLSLEAARSILAIEFSKEDVDRMHELLEKANSGTITPNEQDEANSYERIGHMLALLQSKARKSLKESDSAT